MPNPAKLKSAIRDLMLAKDPPLDPDSWTDKGYIAADLWGMAGPDRPEKTWTAVYVQNVITGKIKPSPLFLRAMDSLGASLDSVPRDVAKAKPVNVLVLNGKLLPGTLISHAETRRCAYPPCGLKFMPAAWNQQYHCLACKRAHYKLKAGRK